MPQYGHFLWYRISFGLPSLLHSRDGRPVAKGARRSLHLEQRVPKVLQVDGRKYGRAGIQLPARLLGVGAPLRSTLLGRTLDCRQSRYDVEL